MLGGKKEIWVGINGAKYSTVKQAGHMRHALCTMPDGRKMWINICISREDLFKKVSEEE